MMPALHRLGNTTEMSTVIWQCGTNYFKGIKDMLQ